MSGRAAAPNLPRVAPVLLADQPVREMGGSGPLAYRRVLLWPGQPDLDPLGHQVDKATREWVRFETSTRPRGGVTERMSARRSGNGGQGTGGLPRLSPTLTGVMAQLRSAVPTLAELRAQRDGILAIAQAHGARNLRVTGSVAVGEAGPGSDIDFVVDLDDDRDVADLSTLILDLEEALGRRVDVLETRNRSALAALLLRDAVPL